MKKLSYAFITVICVFIFNSELHSKIYEWTDENGVTHISNRPPKQKIVLPDEPKDEKPTVVKGSPYDGNRRGQVPGTKISLIPPQGFSQAKRFPGFLSIETSSSILVTSYGGAFDEFEGSFNEKNLSERGMHLIKREHITVCGNRGMLANIAQTSMGVLFGKWIVSFGFEEDTYLVTAAFPYKFRDALSENLRSSVLSTMCSSKIAIDPDASLTFSIKELDRMKLADRMGNSVTMTINNI